MYCFHKKIKVKKSNDLFDQLKKQDPSLKYAVFTIVPDYTSPCSGTILDKDGKNLPYFVYKHQPCHAYVRDMPADDGITIVSSFDWTVTPKEYIKFLFGKDSPWMREFFNGGLEVRCYLDQKKRFTHYTIKMNQTKKYKGLVANFCIATRLFTEHKNTAGLLWLDLLDTGKVDAIGAYKMLALYNYKNGKCLVSTVSSGHYPLNKHFRLDRIRHKDKFVSIGRLNDVWGTKIVDFTNSSVAADVYKALNNNERKAYTPTFKKAAVNVMSLDYSPEFLTALVTNETIAAFINE